MSANKEHIANYHRGLRAAQGRWMKLPASDRAEVIRLLKEDVATLRDDAGQGIVGAVDRRMAAAKAAAVAALMAIGGARG